MTPTSKTVIFLGSRNFGEKNDANALARHTAAQLGAGYRVVHVFFEDLVFHIADGARSVVDPTHNLDLASADLVIALNWYPAGKQSLRDIALTVGLYLQEHAVKLWNSEVLQQRSSTKLSAMWLLSQAGVAVPETYFSLNRQLLLAACPLETAVVKAIAASRGRDNYLVKSRQELETVLHDAKAASARYMVQGYIANDYDIRLVCFDGQPQLALKRQRQSQDTHLNNTSQGGMSTVLAVASIPSEVLQQATTICRLFKREMAGIDYIVANDGTSRYICLEVNAIPQLTSGSYLEEKQQQLSQAIQAAISAATPAKEHK